MSLLPLLLALVPPLVVAPPASARQHSTQRPAEPAPNGESWALFQGLARVTRAEITVPTGPAVRAGLLLARGLKLSRSLEAAVNPDEPDPEALRILAGLPSEPALEPLARRLGLEPLETGFRLLGRDYTRPGDTLVAVFEDPLSAGRPLCLVLGNGKDELAAYLDEIPRLSRPYLWVHEDGEPALECPLELDGRPCVDALRDYHSRREEYFAGVSARSVENLTIHARPSLERERWLAYAPSLNGAQQRLLQWMGVKEPPAVELFVYDHLEDFEACLGTSRLSLANRLRPRVHVLLAPGMPDDSGAGLAGVLAREIAGHATTPWIEEGLAIAAADRWWQRSLDNWLRFLQEADLLPKPNELFALDAAERFSEHVLQPARAMVVAELVKGAKADRGRVRSLWKGGEPPPQKIAWLYRQGIQGMKSLHGKGKPGGQRRSFQLPNGGRAGGAAKGARRRAQSSAGKPSGADTSGGESSPKGRASPRAKADPDGVAAPEEGAGAGAQERAPSGQDSTPQAPDETRPARDRRLDPALAQRLARLGARAPRGNVFPQRHGLALVEDEHARYSSRALEGALDDAAALGKGFDAVSLTVLATTEDPVAPFLSRELHPNHGSASDLALANAAVASQARGLSVLLSLEVLASPTGAWADVISWTGEGDQERFAQDYERLALHYALLAELFRAEVFSFGSNLRESTRSDTEQNVRDPERVAQNLALWKALIAKLHAAFGGWLTYGARGSDSEDIGFFGDLDLIGYQLYPRLLRVGSPPDALELERGLRYNVQQALDLAVRWNKPLVFLQVGFPSRSDSWERTWAPRGDVDPAAQTLYFEALGRVLGGRLENGQSLRGYFLWNWPLDEARSGPEDGGFSLRGKPVDDVLRRLFTR